MPGAANGDRRNGCRKAGSSLPPLLTIAIPTFNRAHRLRVALEAVLPQTSKLGDTVEVVVSDNASEDDTRAVVETFQATHAVSYFRNSANLGPIRNIVRLTTELASGRFVWVLGDDDLVHPTAVQRVVSAIEEHPELEVWYLNFRIARFPEDWPEQAHGGFAGESAEAANRDLGQRLLARWQDVVRPESAMATQVYAHVVPTRVWKDYWHGRAIGQPFSEARWTWPHTFMIAETMANRGCLYVGDPVLTIFEGGQTWTEQVPAVVLLRVPELLRFYSRMGVSRRAISIYRNDILRTARSHLVTAMRARDHRTCPSPRAFLAATWRHPQAWRTYLGAVADASPTSIIGSMVRAARSGRRLLQRSTRQQEHPP